MSRFNQKGFEVIGVGLIVLVGLLIIGTGYYVWNSQKNNKNSTTLSSNKSQTPSINNFEECKKASGSTMQETFPEICVTRTGQHFVGPTETSTNETSTWFAYKSPGSEYSMKLADGWHMTQNGSSIIYQLDNELAVRKSIKATVQSLEGGKDFSTGLIFFYSPTKLTNDNTGASKQQSLVTESGNNVDVYYFKQTAEPQAIGPPLNGECYTYYISKNGKTVKAYYCFGPDQTDYHSVVESVVKTINIS